MDPFAIDPELIENDKVRITEDENGNLALEHKPTNVVLTIDEDASTSEIGEDWEDVDEETIQPTEGRGIRTSSASVEGLVLEDTSEESS